MQIVICINKKKIELDSESSQDEDRGLFGTDNDNALELALQLKEGTKDAKIIVLAAGNCDLEDMIRECIAKGADEGYCLTDDSFDYENPWNMASILSNKILQLGTTDLVIVGKQSFDLGIIPITVLLAEKLKFDYIGQVKDFECKNNIGISTVKMDNFDMKIETPFPIVLSVLRDINNPRYTTVDGMLRSMDADIKICNAEDLAINLNEATLNGPMHTLSSFALEPREKGITIEGDTAEDIAANLLYNLRKQNVI